MARDMFQWAKCLLNKHKDLNSLPITHAKAQISVKEALRRAGKANPSDRLAIQSSSNSESKFRETLPPKQRQKMTGNRYPDVESGFNTCRHT